MCFTKPPLSIRLKRWNFGTNPSGESRGEVGKGGSLLEGVRGFPCLQETELRRRDSGRKKQSLDESIRPSRGRWGVGLRSWVLSWVEEDEYGNSLSMDFFSLFFVLCVFSLSIIVGV